VSFNGEGMENVEFWLKEGEYATKYLFRREICSAGTYFTENLFCQNFLNEKLVPGTHMLYSPPLQSNVYIFHPLLIILDMFYYSLFLLLEYLYLLICSS
jgi:hypothetical protein